MTKANEGEKKLIKRKIRELFDSSDDGEEIVRLLAPFVIAYGGDMARSPVRPVRTENQ